MSALLVQDYLQTQGLQLPQDEVLVALRLAQAVISMGAASVERSILWYANDEAVLAEHIEADAGSEALLKQIFMALDSAFERAPCQSAVVYGLMPSENENTTPYLLRLAQQGAAYLQSAVLATAQCTDRQRGLGLQLQFGQQLVHLPFGGGVVAQGIQQHGAGAEGREPGG